MIFYLKPPDGSITTYKLERFAETRLKLLLALLNEPTENLEEIIRKHFRSSTTRLDCIIEGTPKDRVSHFVLRSALITNPTMHQMIVDGEKLLFEKRFQLLDVETMELAIKHLLRHVKDYLPFIKKQFAKSSWHSYFESITTPLSTILTKKLLRCRGKCHSRSSVQEPRKPVFCQTHGDNYLFEVPFVHITDLIGDRRLHLYKGLAKLKCHDVPVFLNSVFVHVLESSSFAMRNSLALKKCFEEDVRLMEISRRLKGIIHSQGTLGFDQVGCWKYTSRILPSRSSISLKTLDCDTGYFPPCMRTHYTLLRTSHRLPHELRFQFTLFLKDIGFPVEDAIKLIKQEYSKSPCDMTEDNHSSSQSSSCSSLSSSTSSSPSKCLHSWEKDSNRYIYGTRHMYGLEGARRNYSSHSCQALIKSTKSGTGNGCPFVNCHQNAIFQKNLENDLESEQLGNQHVPQYLEKLKHETNIVPIEACHIYLTFKKQKLLGMNSTSCSTTIQTPAPNNVSQNCQSIESMHSHSCVNNYFSKPSHFYTVLKSTGNNMET